jgi:hypothetical protein
MFSRMVATIISRRNCVNYAHIQSAALSLDYDFGKQCSAWSDHFASPDPQSKFAFALIAFSVLGFLSLLTAAKRRGYGGVLAQTPSRLDQEQSLALRQVLTNISAAHRNEFGLFSPHEYK